MRQATARDRQGVSVIAVKMWEKIETIWTQWLFWEHESKSICAENLYCHRADSP